MDDKIATFIHNVSAAIAAVVIGFWRAWDIFIVLLSAWPALILAGFLSAKTMEWLRRSTEKAYSGANAVAQESFANIRCVSGRLAFCHCLRVGVIRTGRCKCCWQIYVLVWRYFLSRLVEKQWPWPASQDRGGVRWRGQAALAVLEPAHERQGGCAAPGVRHGSVAGHVPVLVRLSGWCSWVR